MKKLVLITATAALIAALTGCSGDSGTAANSSSQEENTASVSQTDETESSTNNTDATELSENNADAAELSEDNTDDGAPSEGATDDAALSEGNTDESALTENNTESEFTNLVLEVSKGTLYICAGDSFSLTHRDGIPADFEINNGTLYFSYDHTEKAVLTLPENGSYETLQLIVGEGHIYTEGPLTFQCLDLDISKGEVTLDTITFTDASSVYVKHGSAYLSGNLGRSVTAECEEGHIGLFMPLSQKDYNYEVNLSGGGSIQIGRDNYHGRSVSKSIDNSSDQSIALICSRGEISVQFE